MADAAIGIGDLVAARRDLWARRVLICLFAVIVVAGAFGRLGVRSGTETITTDAGQVQLTYAEVARPGLAVPWRLEVDGIDASAAHTIEVSVSTTYVDAFDFNNLTPEPESITRTPETITFEFSVEGAASFEMAFDTRVEPAVQSKRSADVMVTLDDQQLADLDITTWVLP